MLDMQDVKFQGLKLAADWIRDLEGSDSRLHKESVIEKALMASKLGSSNAQCFLFNCYQAYNPYYVFGVKKVPETKGLKASPILGQSFGPCWKVYVLEHSQDTMPRLPLSL
jgi:hypothetical protein